MSKTCFCGTEEGCVFQIETDMEQHDKLIYEQGYNKAIDEFAEWLKNKLVLRYGSATPTEQYVAMQVTDWCNEIAEQSKRGVT